MFPTELTDRPLRIVLPGGSGHIGHILSRYFHDRGHQVVVLTRLPYAAPWKTVKWDGENRGLWTDYLEHADACINLAGESANCRPTPSNLVIIRDSRIRSIRLLGEVISTLASPPRVWLNASTALTLRNEIDGIEETATNEAREHEQYGQSRNTSVDRNSLESIAEEWEAAFFTDDFPQTRRVALRNAIVCSPTSGGAFASLLNLVRVSLGGTIGSGSQFVSWIHDYDLARAVDFLISRDDLDGPFNISSPYPTQNSEFMRILRDAWEMPNGIPLPTPLFRLGALLFGFQPDFLLKSWCALPDRLQDAGFEFALPAWPDAAEDLVRRWRETY